MPRSIAPSRIACAAAWFWAKRDGQRSRGWMACALAFGGVNASLAGVSFQLLGWELKCRGRPLCLFTNWFEVWYLIANAT